jgi:2-iminobutanoate/2-iminopropanoate deaminase
MTIERSNPPGTAYTGMSQAVKAGGWIHISGQVALRDGAVVGVGNGEQQAEQCFSNIASALESAGAGLENIVKLTCYLTDKNAYAGYAAVRNKLLAEQAPASTVVIISALLMPDLLMEVEAMAWVG